MPRLLFPLLLLLLLLPSCTARHALTQSATQTTTLAQSATTHLRDTIHHRDTIHLSRRDTLLHRDTILLKTYPSSDTIIRQLIIHRQSVRLLHDTTHLSSAHLASAALAQATTTAALAQATTTTATTSPRQSLLHRLSTLFWLLVILSAIYLLLRERSNHQ